MGFSRQEYGSKVSCPPKGIFLAEGLNLCLLCLLHWLVGSLALMKRSLIKLHIFQLNAVLSFFIRSWWSEQQSAPGLAFADCVELLRLQLQGIQLIWFRYWPSGGVHVYCGLVLEGAHYDQCDLLAKLMLNFALLCFAFQGQICLLLQVSLDWLLLYSSPLWWKRVPFLVLVLEGLVCLHGIIQLQLLHH